MASRTPPLLEPYLTLPPEASLILLTSVLGASTNWLTLRFLHNALSTPTPSSQSSENEEVKVVLVSFMRDLNFWKENARRLGLDLDKLSSKKRFTFIDGLTNIFIPPTHQKPSPSHILLTHPDPKIITGEIQKTIRALHSGQDQGKVILIIDQLDFLLAAAGESVDSTAIEEMVVELREDVYSTVMTISADQPLVQDSRTQLEIDHAAFLLSTAHQADFIMGLRLLDSGTARDVSGVVRVTVGGNGNGDGGEGYPRVEEKELLYFVGGDGGVKVFERGQ